MGIYGPDDASPYHVGGAIIVHVTTITGDEASVFDSSDRLADTYMERLIIRPPMAIVTH